MALPGIYNPTEPQATEAVASGPAKLQQNFQALADFLGIPSSPSSLTAAAFAITTGGVVTISQPGPTVAADPTTALGIATKQYVDGKAVTLPVGTASGVNTYAVTLSPVPASLAALVRTLVTVTFTSANTGASTLNPNGLGAVALTLNGAALVSGNIVAGQTYICIYDGANFDMIGPVVTGTGVNNPPVLRALKTADQSLATSTVLTADTALLFAVAASESWQFDFSLYVTHSSIGGLDVAVTCPAAASILYNAFPTTILLHPNSGVVTSGGRITVVQSGLGGTQSVIKVSGTVVNSTNAGSVTLQFSQDASDATATIIKANSSLVATRLSP